MSDEHKPHEEEQETPDMETAEAAEQGQGEADAAAAMAAEAGEPSPEAVMDEMRDRLLRALADAENTRRRAERDREDALKYSITKFARDVLSVADNLRRALASVDDDARAQGGEALTALLDGVSVTERELQNVLTQHGIKQVNPEAGEKFDPNLHQAMAEVPGTGQPNGTVVQVTQIGYTIGDRLLRPAMVLVAKDA
jgi:molecular chaperone GrpE